MLAVYLAACVYEALHDDRARKGPPRAPSRRGPAALGHARDAFDTRSRMKTATALASATDLPNDLKRMSTRPASAGLPARSSETVSCYLCGAGAHRWFSAEDDLTGRPGRFQFVTARLRSGRTRTRDSTLDHVAGYYDDNYIAHRKKRDWGPLTPLFNQAMGKLDLDKERLVARYCPLTTSPPRCWTSGADPVRFFGGSEPLRCSGGRSGLQGHVVEPVSRRESGFTKVSSTSVDFLGRPVRRRDDVAFPGARLRSAAQPRGPRGTCCGRAAG